MTESFFEQPILNSPYEYPGRHWELDETGQPTNVISEKRRIADFITPIPKPKKQKASAQKVMVLEDSKGLSTEAQQYGDTAEMINALRTSIDQWRALPNPADWQVTPETARLLQHWRSHEFQGIRPFFCQVEAIETLIYLTEVAPQRGREGRRFLDYLEAANEGSNPGLARLALKLATGAGKTTVMAMLIAWQTINAVRRPQSRRFTKGFLVIAPGITIRDRLRVLQPNDPDAYYESRELVPRDMMPDLEKAKIVITNYHAFKPRETVDISRGTRAAIEGWRGERMQTLETEGQVLQRVMPELMGVRNLMVINDEAHHCYREKPGIEEGESDEGTLKGDDLDEAKKNKEAARLWISGIEAVNRKLGVARVVDLSATPFFLRGSGYAEGTLFPWTMSDFSLMDAIECGIVKLPRVPVSEDIPGNDMPMFRNLWEHIRDDLPRAGRRKAADLDPMNLPTHLITALEALYGHYKATFEEWQRAGDPTPPCFIIVCQNTAISELVFKFISGYLRTDEHGAETLQQTRFELFSNFNEHGQARERIRTLLIDSLAVESGEQLSSQFRATASDEIERFRRERVLRTGRQETAGEIPDSEVLREVMNTVGKEGQLGEQIRCVVSVSMLTEGWDANNVTHILGIRAFGTQLLCEQVVGRALRRSSYELNDAGLFDPEYADILGIPFDFTAKPVVPVHPPRKKTVNVRAVSPERDSLEIQFPNVAGYRTELPSERLAASFGPEAHFRLDPSQIGPTEVENAGIIGESAQLTLAHTRDLRRSTLVYELATQLLMRKFRDPGEEPKLYLFPDLRRIVRQWLDECFTHTETTYPAQLLFPRITDLVCERINAAITAAHIDTHPVKALLDPYNPLGSTSHVNFNTSRDRWQTDPTKCHVNWVILDSDWEAEFCRVVEKHPRVRAYVKNHNLGLEVPYRYKGEVRHYIPDFVVLVEDGHGEDDLLRLVVEIKGYRGEDAKEKKSTMDTYWIPGVNNLGTYGRWAFAEFRDVYAIQSDFEAQVESRFNEIVDDAVTEEAGAHV